MPNGILEVDAAAPERHVVPLENPRKSAVLAHEPTVTRLRATSSWRQHRSRCGRPRRPLPSSRIGEALEATGPNVGPWGGS
jgi:hypothetical protein